MKLETGIKTDSGNFELVKPIHSMDRLAEVLVSESSIFFRHRMYPTAFIMSWQFRMLNNSMIRGWLWETKKINKTKKQ
jgi:hypothetical protein